MWNTIQELSAHGHSITFISPDLGLEHREIEDSLLRYCHAVHLVPARAWSHGPSLIRAVIANLPLSIVRHSHPAVRRTLTRLVTDDQFDVLHAEQIHSLANLPAATALPPVVLRAQNVESHLWRKVAQVKAWVAWFARREARRMGAYEARALTRVGATITLTQRDGTTLGGASGMAAHRIRVIPPPFPSLLETSPDPLDGSPAIVLVSGGWLPNKDSTRWFLTSIWSEILNILPEARAHIFGGTAPPAAPSVSWYGPPTDSTQLFRRNSILVVPLRIASGIRMKILEAWARGVPVVATPEAVRGLGGVDGREFLLADTAPGFARAVRELHTQMDLRRSLVESGRAALTARYAPESVVSELEDVYRDAVSTASPVSARGSGAPRGGHE